MKEENRLRNLTSAQSARERNKMRAKAARFAQACGGSKAFLFRTSLSYPFKKKKKFQTRCGDFYLKIETVNITYHPFPHAGHFTGQEFSAAVNLNLTQL